MKKYLAKLWSVVLVISMLAVPNALAAGSPQAPTGADGVSDQGYITFEAYLEKYGEENVAEGFQAAEAAALGYDRDDPSSQNTYHVLEGKSLFECLSEGTFLGFKVLGVSDVAPDDPDMVIHLDSGDLQISPPVGEGSGASPAGERSTISSKDYIYYYSNTKPDPDLMRPVVYEPNAGSYFYKYSYPYGGHYQCDTTVTFKNTSLYCGTQNCCSYIFLNARSDTSSIDFGLMANPADSYRNQGLYAFWTPNPGKLSVEAYPKVSATFYSTASKLMRLEDKTITIKLGVDTDRAIMAMESGGSVIFYRTYDLPGLASSTSGKPLTFIQAMSCIAENAVYTLPNSGTYLKNVQFSNTTLHTASGAKPFTTIGPYTSFTYICRPDDISCAYDDAANTEAVSIVYNSSRHAEEDGLVETDAERSDPMPRMSMDQQLQDIRTYTRELAGCGASLEEHPSSLGTLAVQRTPDAHSGASWHLTFYKKDGESFDIGRLLPKCCKRYLMPRDIDFSEDGSTLTFITPIREDVPHYEGDLFPFIKDWGDTLCTVDLSTGELLSLELVDQG